MFYVVQKVFSPTGQQLDSDSVAEFSTESEANAMADHLATEQDNCPPNADENRLAWHVEAE